MSENINKDFFQNDVPKEIENEQKDGRVKIQNKGTLLILDDWLRKFFRTDDGIPWDNANKTFRKIRKLRQKPAHSINENIFDQRFFKEQRELIIEAYTSIRTLRMMIENHPKVRNSKNEVPEWLRGGKIWTY